MAPPAVPTITASARRLTPAEEPTIDSVGATARPVIWRANVREACVPGERVRLLATGADHWHDGDGVRAMLRFAFETYGGPAGATLMTFDGDGAEAIARRAWRRWPGTTTDPVILEPDREAHGFAARLVCFERIVEQDTVTAVLSFVTERGDGGARKVMRRARELGIPVWRWSIRLRRPVPGGEHVHTPEWREQLAGRG